MMSEADEFAESLLDQIDVEIQEEKKITESADRISEDPGFRVKFEPLEDAAGRIFDDYRERAAEFTGLQVPTDTRIEFLDLKGMKIVKGKRVHAAHGSREYVDALFEAVSRNDKKNIATLFQKDSVRFLTYSTYVKSYISNITTTYGEYLEPAININKFVLSRYPQIILYGHGAPYEARFDDVHSGYIGALKMTILGELIHSMQGALHKEVSKWATVTHQLSEELASNILALDDGAAATLCDHLDIRGIPDDFPMAIRANLFFTLHPQSLVINELGPQAMAFTKIQVDPKILEHVPNLAQVCQEWLAAMRSHGVAFDAIEGMTKFCIKGMIPDDGDFKKYLEMFMGTDAYSYLDQKSTWGDFIDESFKLRGREIFGDIIGNPPTTNELASPNAYLKRIQAHIR